MIGIIINITDGCGGAERRLIRIFNRIALERNDIRLIIIGNENSVDIIKENYILGKLNFKEIVVLPRYRSLIKYLILQKHSILLSVDLNIATILINTIIKLKSGKTMTVLANYYQAKNIKGSLIGALKLKVNDIRTKKNEILIAYFAMKTIDYMDCLYPKYETRLKEEFTNVKISITPNSFTDLEKFFPKKKKNLMVFSAARLEAIKNPILLAKAVELIQDEIRKHKYQIYIYGKGYQEKYINSFILDNKIEDILIMKGYSDMSKVLPQAKVFFSLQVDENYPSQSMIEAIASGCCIIATDVGDTSKIAKKEFSLLVENDKESLAKGILVYLNEMDQCKIEINARKFAEKHLNIETSVNYFMKILNKLSD